MLNTNFVIGQAIRKPSNLGSKVVEVACFVAERLCKQSQRDNSTQIMGNEAITIPLDQMPQPRPAPEGFDEKKKATWEKDEKKRVEKETKALQWKLQTQANQERRRINREMREDKRLERDEKKAAYRDKQRDKFYKKQGYHDKISG
jgi:hypothetical protein